MPGKSSSSKPAKPATEPSGDASLAAESAKPKKSTGKKVLSLIEEAEEKKNKAKVPRKGATSMLPQIGAKSVSKKEIEPVSVVDEVAKPSLDDRKKAALSLFEEKPKKRERPVTITASVSALPPISLLLDEPTKPKSVLAPPPPVVETPLPEFELSESGEKIIHLKPPVIVKDLAEKMGLKP
ncbi:MAG: hypothetical protein ACKO8Z_01545, partial [Prosthecobacter sp.]